MPETDIDSTVTTDFTSTFQDFSVDTETTDAGSGHVEVRWQIEDFHKNLGYYKNVPELKAAIDTKANWVIGAGFEADEETELLLMSIKGNGKDSFNSILKNMWKMSIVAGDSFAEIIRDGVDLVNLKPLDPNSMVIVQNKEGRIIRYEQVNKHKKPMHKFEPDEMFHLSRDRVADEIHGTSIIPSVEKIILARNEAIEDFKKVMHRYVKPFFIHHLDTDDVGEIAKYKATYDTAKSDGEDLFVPKGVVVPELVSTAQNATLNPLTWINNLTDYFYQAVNTPQIIMGNAKEFTDASGKIVYLAFEQSVKAEQLYIEEQVLGQLNIEIELTFPASLQSDAVSDQPGETDLQEEPQEPATQPNDTTAELEGNT